MDYFAEVGKFSISPRLVRAMVGGRMNMFGGRLATDYRGGVVMSEEVVRVNLELTKSYQFLATFPDMPGVPALHLDEAPPLGQGSGPSPAVLLATAVANCLAASLLFCLRKARIEPLGLRATAALELHRNERGRLRVGGVDVVLTPTTNEGDADRLERCRALFEDFCIVTESIRHGIDVCVEVDVHATV